MGCAQSKKNEITPVNTIEVAQLKAIASESEGSTKGIGVQEETITAKKAPEPEAIDDVVSTV